MNSKIKTIDDLYSEIDELVELLKDEGCVDSAVNLQKLVYETAWTTGSELLGELALHLDKMTAQYSASVRKRLEGCKYFCKHHRRIMGIY